MICRPAHAHTHSYHKVEEEKKRLHEDYVRLLSQARGPPTERSLAGARPAGR